MLMNMWEKYKIWSLTTWLPLDDTFASWQNIWPLPQYRLTKMYCHDLCHPSLGSIVWSCSLLVYLPSELYILIEQIVILRFAQILISLSSVTNFPPWGGKCGSEILVACSFKQLWRPLAANMGPLWLRECCAHCPHGTVAPCGRKIYIPGFHLEENGHFRYISRRETIIAVVSCKIWLLSLPTSVKNIFLPIAGHIYLLAGGYHSLLWPGATKFYRAKRTHI